MTEGHPQVVDIFKATGIDNFKLLQLVAAIGRHSEHPLARAIVKESEKREIEIPENTDFESHPGAGAQADVLGETIRVGKRAYLQNNGIALRKELLNQAQDLQKQGKTVTWVTEGKVLLGAIAIADPIKSTTPDAIATLHRIGIKIIMCTGDNSDTARAVSSTLSIQDYRAAKTNRTLSKISKAKDTASQWHATGLTTRQRSPLPI